MEKGEFEAILKAHLDPVHKAIEELKDNQKQIVTILTNQARQDESIKHIEQDMVKCYADRNSIYERIRHNESTLKTLEGIPEKVNVALPEKISRLEKEVPEKISKLEKELEKASKITVVDVVKWAAGILAAFLAALLVTSRTAHAATLYPEKVYQAAWCDRQGGQAEVVLPDRTRADCLTADYAVEADFACKWEPAQQAMHYAKITGKSPGVLLIVERPEDERCVQRFRDEFYWIRLWTITPGELP